MNNPTQDTPRDPDPNARLVLLTDAYLHDELSAGGLAELERRLQTDPDAARQFITITEQAGMMREVFGSATEQLIAVGDDETDDFLSILSELDAPQSEAPAPIDFTAERARRATNAKAKTRRERHIAHKKRVLTDEHRPVVIPHIAVFFAIAAALGLVVWLGWPRAAPIGRDNRAVESRPQPDTPPAMGASSAPVATLLNSHQPAWGGAGPDGGPRWTVPLADGQMVPGRYALTSGAIELRLNGGAVLLVEGPARFELVDDRSGYLILGRLTVDTTQATGGFRLETATARAQDPGAGGRFGFVVDPGGRTQTHVFAGRLDFSSLGPSGPSASVRLTANDGAVVDRGGAEPARAPVAGEQFALGMAALAGRPVVTGEADYLNQMPASVVMNQGVESSRAWVALESTARPLQRGTAWAQSYPSRPSVLTDTGGRVVDSYLVVFDPVGEPEELLSAEFELTFPGEVLTVIAHTDDLIASQGWYSASDTRYDVAAHSVFGLEYSGVLPVVNTPPQPDLVVLGADGRSLRVWLRVSAGADVFRVLVLRSDTSPPRAER